jgi:hypothetical protein
MKSNLKKIISGAILAGIILGIVPLIVQAGGIVPCGNENTPCNLCDLLLGINNLIQWGLGIVTVIAIVAIFFAGIMYIISAGDSSMMQTAKGFMSSALIGFAIFLGAWLIVYVVMTVLSARPDSIIDSKSWNSFTCNTSSGT